MFLVSVIGFLVGLCVPSMASRFGKILPADPGLVLVKLWHKPHFPLKCADKKRISQLQEKWGRLILFSFFWGVVLGALYSISYLFLAPEQHIYAYLFLFFVAMLMAVDQQYFLLPDFFTIPLLLLGITQAFALNADISLVDAICGAWFGYILSTVSVLIMSIFKKAEFGAGDVKMLTALGAWFGCIGLNYALIGSFLVFFLTACIKKKKTGAYGPALGIASIFVFFYLSIK